MHFHFKGSQSHAIKCWVGAWKDGEGRNKMEKKECEKGLDRCFIMHYILSGGYRSIKMVQRGCSGSWFGECGICNYIKRQNNICKVR